MIQLGSHVGLTSIIEIAAEAIVQRPWADAMQVLKEVIELPVYRQDIVKMDSLLHHSKRGAYTELQVLELLDSLDMNEGSIATVLKVESMQREELHAVLNILLQSHRHSGILLRKALEQHLLPESLRADTVQECHTRFLHNIMLTGKRQVLPLPKSRLALQIEALNKDGKSVWPWRCHCTQCVFAHA